MNFSNPEGGELNEKTMWYSSYSAAVYQPYRL